jgi:cytochrome c553
MAAKTWIQGALVGATLALSGTLASCGPKAQEEAAAPVVVDETPTWAYPMTVPAAAPAPSGAPSAAPPPPDPTLFSVPGAKNKFTRAQIRDIYNIADWRPEDHSKMPKVVYAGRKPEVRACGYCHTPAGTGRPENARLAGLPKGYFIAQMKAYRDGLRVSAVPGRGPTTTMQQVGHDATEAEAEEAAIYFAAQQPRSFLRVVETDTTPPVQEVNFIFKQVEGARVPLGMRIIEAPEDFEQFELRDPRAGFVAYVPKGSIARGKTLAESWGEERVYRCASCHGENLKGKDDVPGLAGKSPTFIGRQLHDLKVGTRKGGQSELMIPVVKDMRNADIVALAAYLGSLAP